MIKKIDSWISTGPKTRLCQRKSVIRKWRGAFKWKFVPVEIYPPFISHYRFKNNYTGLTCAHDLMPTN